MNTVNGYNEPIYLTAKEAAEFLGVSRVWLFRNRQSTNVIPYSKVGGRIFYEKNEIIASIDSKRKSKKPKQTKKSVLYDQKAGE